MDIPLPGEIIPFPSSSPPMISKSPPPMPPLPPDFDHIPLPPSVGKQNLSPPTVNHMPKAPPPPPTAPPLPSVLCKTFPNLPPLPSSPKGVPSMEAKGNGEAILWSSIPPPPAPAPPTEDSRYSPSHATPADEENERMLLPPSFSLLPPPPPPADSAPNPPPSASMHSPPKMPPLPPSRPPPPVPRSEPPPLPAPPPKTAVLGKMQAKKRLLAFSMTKQGGGLGLSFGFAKSARVVNKASANAFVGSGEDEEASEKKESTNKNRKKKKEEREVLAIEEIKREEERLKEALGIRQVQRMEQWAEEMWGLAAPAGEGMLTTTAAVAGAGAAAQTAEDAASAGEGTTVVAMDAAAPGANQEGTAASAEVNRLGEKDAGSQGEAAVAVLQPEEATASAEQGDAAKGKEEPGEVKEERKEGGGGSSGEKREKKGDKGRSSKKDERSRRREEEGSSGGDKERSKRGKGGGSGRSSERRSERKRESRRGAVSDGPPSGWKQLKEMFGGEWKGEKIPHRMSGSREDRGRDRRGSRRHGSRSRDHKRSGHSSHRSRSGSADVHRRPQSSPFFVAKGAKHGEKEFPLRLLRHTRTRPPLSYCENPETAAPPRPTTRKEAFASEPPEVVRIMRLVAESGLEKESEGRENSKEASGLAALRVSYEGGDEEEVDEEQKRSDRSWFLTLAAFLSESSSSSSASARVALKRSASPRDISPSKDKVRERKRDKEKALEGEANADSEGSVKAELKEDLDGKEEEGEEEVAKAEMASTNEAAEPTVHSKWDSDPDSSGVATLEKDKAEAMPSPEVKSEPLEVSEGEEEVEENGEKGGEEEEGMEVEVGGEEEKEEEACPTPLAIQRSESNEESGESEDLGEESQEEEGEEKKDQQLASEYEEFMKAVSVGEDDEDDDVWGLDREREDAGSCEVSDHRDSDSSEQNSPKVHESVRDRSSDIEMASDVPSSEDAGGKVVADESSSDFEVDRNSILKEENVGVDEKAVGVKEKSAKRKERTKRDNSESGAESEVEIQIPKKKRKTSGKKLTALGEGMKKKTMMGGEKRRKLKGKEKSDKKKKEKERRRKRKKKDRKKKKGRRRREDSSEVDSESKEDEEDGSESNGRTMNTKASRSKVSDGIRKRRSHARGEPSSEEESSDNSSESSDEVDRRKPRKKKRKKRRKQEKSGLSKEEEEELSDDEGEGRKGKVHYSRRKRAREAKNKHHRESDNSDGSEEADDHHAVSGDKTKASDDGLMEGKENGVEGSGKRERKQKLKERGRKKKRKSSPPNPKKHMSSRRRSPSTSDGSPTPGKGSHQRGNSVSKTQGSRGGTSEGGPSSIESNSSGGGTKKPGDNTAGERKPSDSSRRRESSRVEGGGSQRKRSSSEREEKRIHDSSCRSKSSKASPVSASKSGGITNKEKSLKGSTSVKRNAQESVSKKRAMGSHSPNTSSSSSSSTSSSSSSPSSCSQSVSSSSSSTESSSSGSSQSDSCSVSSSSSSSSSSAMSSVCSLTSSSSSSSSSESSSSISSFANLPSSPKAIVAVAENIESENLAKESSKKHILSSLKEFSRSLSPPEPHMLDISFSSLSKDSSKLVGHCDHFEDSVSKFSRMQSENCKVLVNDRKNSQVNESPRMRVDCTLVDPTNAPGRTSSDIKPSAVMGWESESDNLIGPADSHGHNCSPVGLNETIQPEQKDNSTPLNSTSKPSSDSRESKSQILNPEPLVFKLCFEEDPANGKILGGGERAVGSAVQPSRPSRWDTRPVLPECQAVPPQQPCATLGGREGGVREGWEGSQLPPLTTPILPVLPVPFPTACRDKPLEEIPLPPVGGSVPQPVASPWGPEGPLMPSAPIILQSSSELPINPVCGLADSTISDSDLVGKCISGAGHMQTAGPESSPKAKKVSLDIPYLSDNNRPTSSESEQSAVEQFPVGSNHFLKTRVNMYQDANQQSADNKLVDCAAGAFCAVDNLSLAKSAELKHAALSGDTECVLSPEADQPPTDWDDPEAFVGPGLTEIKSHVIQVGNFLQVVPSEQPIISHSFTNPTTPVPAVVPLAAVPGGVAPVPVPPAAPISSVLPVAAPTTIGAAFPASVSPVKTAYLPPQASPSPCSMPLAMPVVQPIPVSLPSTPPAAPSSSLASVAPLIPGLSTTLAPSLPPPTSPSPLSHIPLLASLTPSSSCAGISQLPLDPATILGTLISHALALEKQQKQQQQNLALSPVCSPMLGAENEEVPKEALRAMTRAERQARRLEKRKKMVRGVTSQQHAEKFPVEDAMSNTDPLTNAMPEDYCIDPEEVAYIQEAMTKVSGEEDDFEEQNPQVCRIKEKRKKPRFVCNTVLPPATRGILIPPGLREKPSIPSGGIGLNSGTQGQRKSVMFADGVRPGDGTSPSAGEDLPSPPPPMRKVPKEKRLRKKKKIKVKIIRQIRMESTEEDDDEDDDASPPPPPPGSPPPSLLLHHLSTSSPAIHHSGCDVAVPNPAAHYPYPSAPTTPPTHPFSQLQPTQSVTSQQQQPQLTPLNPTSAPPVPMATVPGGSSTALPPNALPRIPQWAPCN